MPMDDYTMNVERQKPGAGSAGESKPEVTPHKYPMEGETPKEDVPPTGKFCEEVKGKYPRGMNHSM